MLSALGVPALALLISVPNIPGIPGLHFPGFRVKHHVSAPADTIPPPWKSASMLALEDQFVIGAISPMLDKANGQGRIQMTNDVRQFQVAVDPDSGTVTVVPQLGEVDLASGTLQGLTEYTNALQRATFRKQWAERSRQNLNSLGSYTPQTTATHSGLSFELPGLLPKRVQSLLGPGSPALNVSGSENIRLAGESNWTNQQI